MAAYWLHAAIKLSSQCIAFAHFFAAMKTVNLFTSFYGEKYGLKKR